MKKMPNQRHVSKFAELDGGVFPEKKKFYKDANQTENFTGRKPEMTYITEVENTINPYFNDIYYNPNKILFHLSIFF